MQEVRSFFAGVRAGKVEDKPIEDQINDFLKEHPAYTAKNISIAILPLCKEAYVIFDVREEKKPPAGKNNGK